MEYGADHVALYEHVFRSRGKDFEAEAAGLVELIRSRHPAARSLLDVACGTGAHLAEFARTFAHVEGLEFSPAMREFAAARLPEVPVHPGDMRDFELGRTFDAVTCMGNAVAEVENAEEMTASISRMAAHLVPGGVLIIEPWYFPDNFIDGYVGGYMLREDGRVISRMTHSIKQGRKSRMEVKFVIGEAAGFQEFAEVLMNNLFTRAQYEAAFENADCTCEFVPGFELADGRPNSPGLFVGVRK